MTKVEEEEQKLLNLLLMRVSGCHMYIHNVSRLKIFECIIVLWLVPLGAVTSRLTISANAIFWPLCPVSFLPSSIKLPVNLKLCPSHVPLVSWCL